MTISHLSHRVLGIEGGGTKTEWVLADGAADGEPSVTQRGLLPSANLKLSGDDELTALFSTLPREVGAVGVFLAGCATPEEHDRLRRLAARIWPAATIVAGSDRESAMAACFRAKDGIIVIAGTGAAVHGRKGDQVERAGGWGQLLGDRGGAYSIAIQGLRSVLTHYDLNDEISPFAQDILRQLALNGLRDLVDWVYQADKMSVASLAPVVFDAARRGDAEAEAIIQRGARFLAKFTQAVAHRLEEPRPAVRLFGGLFAHNAAYAEIFTRQLEALSVSGDVAVCCDSGAVGAAWLAARNLQSLKAATATEVNSTESPEAGGESFREELAEAGTEQRHPQSTHLDQLPTRKIVDLFVIEEAHVATAVQACADRLAEAADLVAGALLAGGRLFYAGAGTSGRLGVLDASEIPPTFGASPELVQGIIAGGPQALHRAVEGAEDFPAGGALAIRSRGVRAGDVVCGIAASGRTPFVLGALTEARQLGARTLLLTCNPSRHRAGEPWDIEIDLPTGPEILTGSTRLKAGSATKAALNILSTCAMVRLGKVRGNLMIDVRITNAKLRDRGIRLVSETLGISYEDARIRLEKSGWNVRGCLGEH